MNTYNDDLVKNHGDKYDRMRLKCLKNSAFG